MTRKMEMSRKLQQRAEQMIPGGVNSPVRAFGSVGGDAPFILRGQGSHIFDADGNEYIDYVGSWGPLILGHAPAKVIEAIMEAACNGTSFGASTPAEADLAEIVLSAFPHMQKVRFVNSGTEATMSAIRLARAYTKRKYIMKFEGCYHGHADALPRSSAICSAPTEAVCRADCWAPVSQRSESQAPPAFRRSSSSSLWRCRLMTPTRSSTHSKSLSTRSPA